MGGLRIGIDARGAADEPAGRGRAGRELLRALAARDEDHSYRLYARRAWDGATLDERFGWRLDGSRDVVWHWRTARAASRECDVLLSSDSYLTTWFVRIPAVPIVYDLIPFEPALRPRGRSVVIERLTLGPAVRRSAALICISQATADALVRHFPAARGKEVVAPLGVSPALTGDELPAGVPAGRYVLAVGTLEPRKNLPRLVDAYASLDGALQRRHPLVVVGPTGWQTGETLDALHSLGDRCCVLGFVSDAELAALYRECAVFAYPSLGEGFGLPVLEALAAGAPVLTSDRSSLPEVGGDAVAYCDPTDTAAIAGALGALLGDPARRAQLAARGPVRAASFSWDRYAERVLATLAAAAEHRIEQLARDGA